MQKANNIKLWLVSIIWMAAIAVLLSSLVVGSAIIGKSFWDRSQANQMAGELDASSEKTSGNKPQLEANGYPVTRVIDGDTILLEGIGTVRIIGIDTPELRSNKGGADCFAHEAKKQLEALIEGKLVYLEYDPSQDKLDRYGRTLAYVFLQDPLQVQLQQLKPTDLGLELISRGYAFEYTYRSPYKYQTQYKQAALKARQDGIGLWDNANCSYSSVK